MEISNKTTLFCLPYAGASAAATYCRWQRHLPQTIKVAPLELAGHGRRMAEPFYASLDEAVADLLAAISPVARSAPYAIYGHSMGCVMAYELARAAAAAGLAPPKALFLSGRNPPHYIYQRQNLHLLSNELFLAEIGKLGGTPQGFFKMKDFTDTFLPILRSDYRLIERYRHPTPMHVSVADTTFFNSDDDTLVSKPAVFEWQRYTSGAFVLKDFQGGHFFINDCQQEICREIAERLELVVAC